MATVTGKVLKPFSYKGESFEVGEEVKMDAAHAARYEKLDYVKFNREAEAKIEKAVTKESATAPNPPKTK